MNVTLTSLEALILKATNESLSWPDPAALEAFCAVMRHSPDGPQMAAQTLAIRIHIPQTQKALLALAMTDHCMQKCGPDFHAEIGKFRFLNELIKLVSPKYFADRTAPTVRTRILQLLYTWSMEFPKEFKFKVAYDMLKNQGVVTETPPPLPPEMRAAPKVRTKNAVFEDVEKTKLLQKLLQSKKPEDIQHANRLIKTMVREEEKRHKACCHREQDLSTALDSAGLLSDMLEYAQSASLEEIQLIHELYFIVGRMRIVLDDMASRTTDSECLGEIIRANDILNETHTKYEAFVEQQKQTIKPKCSSTNNRESLLDFAGANAVGASNAANDGPKRVAKNAMDELGDIFSTESGSDIAAPLQPVNLMPNDDVDLLGEKTKAEGWNELDSLGEQLLKQSLPENAKRVDSFNGKSKKIPMNALASPKHEASIKTAPVFDLDFFTKMTEDDKPLGLEATAPIPVASNGPVPPNDDIMVDIGEAPSLSTNPDSILDLSSPVSHDPNTNGKVEVTPLTDTKEPLEMKTNSKVKSKVEVKPLTDITVTLDSVHPSNVPPLTAFEDNGVTVVMHFCKDRPRADVNVIVVSTTSRNGLPIEDYKLQCVVPKGCKVRLLTASATSLPAFNPFLPPPAITQVMLIARPPGSPPIDLKFVMTYAMDEDVCSEMGEVKQLPLDDIQ